MARLGDYIEQIRGVSYKPTDLHDSLNEESVALLRANNIQDGHIVIDDVVYVAKNKVVAKQYLKKGDILICTSSGSKELVGKAAYIEENMPMTFGAFCKIIRPKTEYPKYIGHFFQSPYYRRSISDLSAGANINNIRNEHIEGLEIPIPPLDEQRRIAAVLDKASDLIAKRREQLDKLDELVKARFVEMFGDPEFNLRNWPIVSLSDVCTVGSSKRIYQSEQTFDGVPFLRISDLNHLIDTGDFCPSLFISEEKYQELQQHGQVPIEGDILVTSRGTLGRCYIIKTTDRFYFQDGMISWISNLSNEITSLFIAYLFDMQSMKRQIESMQAGSTVSYLSIDMIKRLKIMLPDRNLQKQFGAFVDQTNKSKLTIQQSLDKLERLKKALMQRYWG